MGEIFPYGTVAHVVSGAGFVLTLWLGAYLASHVPRSFPSRLATLSLFALSGYFLHVVLCLFLPAEQAGHLWRRYMGWFALWPLPFWLHLTASLLGQAAAGLQRALIRATYAAAVLLGAAWVTGDWSFSRDTLLPPELVWPISLFAAGVGALALRNVYRLWKRAADRTLARRYALLGAVVALLAAGLLFWSVTVNWLRVSWSPTTRLAFGDGIPLTASLVLAYAVAYHSAFMAGRWVRRDFFFHGASVVLIAALYLLIMLAAWRLAERFGLDVPTLVLIAVIGLALSTHLLAERTRGLWDSLFFKQLRTLRSDVRGLVGEPNASGSHLEEYMAAVVNRLRELTGASIVCLALNEGGQLIVRASTDRERVGWRAPASGTEHEPVPIPGADPADEQGNGRGRGAWDCMVLTEPVRVGGQVAGYLLLGERGVGEGYDRQERVWISALAAHVGLALEQTRRREETERRLAELKSEAEELASREAGLQREFEAILTGPPPRVNPVELREAVYACNRPERLEALLGREESTLAALPCIRRSGSPPVVALQRRLGQALEAIVPPDLVVPVEALRERAMRSKRRRHLPASVADYHTLRLAMAGYTHEAIAEMLEVSPRQVRNYLDRGIGAVKAYLEQEASLLEAETAAKMPGNFLNNS